MTFRFARRVHFSDSTNEASIDVSEKIEHIIPMFGIMWVLAFLLPFVCYSFLSFLPFLPSFRLLFLSFLSLFRLLFLSKNDRY